MNAPNATAWSGNNHSSLIFSGTAELQTPPLGLPLGQLQPLSGTNWFSSSCSNAADLEEDLAECIAAWKFSKPHDGSPPRLKSFNSTFNSTREAAARQAQEPFAPIISVNVGGRVFRTTASTLRKAKFFDSLIKYAEDGAMGATVDDNGRYFVDRSSELFVYILDYLRSGNWVLRDKAGDLEFVDALREEAAFYGLDPELDRFPMPRISEYVTVWQFRDDTSLYVDSHEQTIREDPDHQGLFRLCKYSGGLPLDQQTCTKRFKATSHRVQSVIAYFAMRGFKLQHVIEGSMITHTTSVDGQSRSGHGVQYILSRLAPIQCNLTPPNTYRPD